LSVVTLYTKPGCHLCEQALEALLRVQAERPFELVQVDITADDALHRAYFERIPVVAVDGEHLSDFFLDEHALIERLAQAPGARPEQAPSERLESRRWPTGS
jgi:glutaredoxin